MLAVDMQGITKRFPGMIANDHVNFSVEKGEIHSLLGENGAGKTTLMKVLFGLYTADEGVVRINGQTVEKQTPGKAFAMGLGMVHQHFMLIDNMSVWENVILGSEPGKVVVDRNESKRRVQELSDQYNFELDVEQKVSEISVGMKQRVEILKTLYRGAEILILDEPTAVLTPMETEQLLQILLDMKKEGKTIIFITHKLKETMSVADHITILRGGKSVGRVKKEEITQGNLASQMVGYDIDLELEKPTVKKGDVVLSLKDIRLLPQAKNTVSLDIRAGEVFGIAGVEGNGQQQLEELVMGLARCRSGQILFENQDITTMNVKKRCQCGIGYIPSDRFKHAILPSFSLVDNYLLGNQYKDSFVKKGIIQKKYLEKNARELMKEFDVRAVDEEQTVSSLSGGNQQKMVFSREVYKDSRLYVACQPVRGLDIGAIKFIHKTILDLRSRGKAILLISAELSDLFQLSDWIGVLYKGELLAVKPAEDYTMEEISLLMAGRKEEEVCR